MDCKIVLLLAIAVTSCACYPNAPGTWTLQPSCPCGRVYLPVCGSDGITYSNKCELECTAKFYKYYFDKDMHMMKDDSCDGS